MKRFLLSLMALVCVFAASAATLKITSAEIVSGKTGSVSLGTNSYGSQDVTKSSTWYTFDIGKYSFTGARVASATAANGGGIQMQGNASDATKQAFIYNKTSFGKITNIVIKAAVASTSQYAPGFNVYVGSEEHPTATALTLPTVEPTEETRAEIGLKIYEYSIDVTDEYGYFTVANDLVGALYIDEIDVTYEKELASGDYIIYYPEEDMYLGGANDWGTHASLVEHGQTITLTKLQDGKYSIDTHTYNSDVKHYLAGDYVDAAEASYEIASVEDGFTIKGGDGYVAPSGGTYVTTGAAEPASWQIVSIAEATAALDNATETDPIDATFLVKNANFSRGAYATAMSNSKVENKEAYPWTIEAGNYNLMGGDYKNMCAESWCSAFNVYQTLKVPNGVYALGAQAALTDYTDAYDNTDNYPVLYANEGTAVFNNMVASDRGTSMNQLSGKFTNGDYIVGPIYVEVTDSALTVGVKGTRTNTWCIWDNFCLLYYGTEASATDLALATYKEALEALQDEAADVIEEKMGMAESENLETVMTAEPAEETVEAYEKLISVLQEKLGEAKESANLYRTSNELAGIMKANADAAGVSVDDAFGQYMSDYQAGVLSSEGASPVVEAYKEAVKAAVEAEDAEKNEDAIANPDFEENGVEGWTTAEGWANSNPWLHTSNSANFGIKTNTNFVEGWTPGPNQHGDEALSQTITLPAGKYILTVEAQNLQQGDATVVPEGFKLYAGDAEATITNVAGTYAVAFEVAADDTEVEIGVKAEGCTGNWLCVDNFQLVKTGDVEPAREIVGTPFEISWDGQVIPDDAIKVITVKSKWQSANAVPNTFDPATDKKVVIEFAEPLANGNWNFYHKNSQGVDVWNTTEDDKTGWTIWEAEITDAWSEFKIQNTLDGENTLKIKNAYVVKNDESKAPISWSAGWNCVVSAEGITSGEATISSQWAGVNLTAPEEFLQDGTKTLRIYTNNDISAAKFQWAMTNADGDALYRPIGVSEDGTYAEYTFTDNVKSFYLQHTDTDPCTLDIYAITWTFEPAPYEPAVLVSVSPEAGSKVDFDTEFVATFSQPVKYSKSLSCINIGLNPFSDEDGAIFTQSEDGKTITAKLDKEMLAEYGVTTVEEAINKFGSTVSFILYKVKDVETGELVEGCYDEESDEDQFNFGYKLGDPVLVAEPADGETVEELSEIFFSCADGIERNEESEAKILIMKDKEQIAEVALSDLEEIANDFGFFDEEEDDDFDFGGTVIAGYQLTLAEPLTEKGTYEVYVPAGAFLLGGEEMASPAIFTYTIEGEDEPLAIVGELVLDENNEGKITFSGNVAFVPEGTESIEANVVDEEGNVVATATLTYDAEEWNVVDVEVDGTGVKTGTYKLVIPEGVIVDNDTQAPFEGAELEITVTEEDAPTVDEILGEGEVTFDENYVYVTFSGEGMFDYENLSMICEDLTITKKDGTVYYGEPAEAFVDVNGKMIVKMPLKYMLEKETYTSYVYNPKDVVTVSIIAPELRTNNGTDAIEKVADAEDIVIKNVPVITGINGVAANGNATIYNLGGVQLGKAAKGVNVINGKKVVVKK